MNDPRRTARTNTIAATHLSPDLIGARTQVEGRPGQISAPVSDLLRSPSGPRDRQLLLGDQVQIYETNEDQHFVQAEKDGYVGYVPSDHVAEAIKPTHWISARASHAYSEPDFKSPDRMALSLGSQLRVLSEQGRFAETEQGFVPLQHLAPVKQSESDPVSVAERLIGAPYLWGGNSAWGIDCSGLVQIACLACNIPCPGDSDQQEAELGDALPEGTQYQRGDVLFWKGHVAWVSAPDTLLHANVHHMAVAFEPLEDAITRIERQGDGPVTSHKRISL